MKILVVHQYYLAPGEAGGSRWNEFARMFADAGHEVTVLAGTLSYATGRVPERYRGRMFVEEHDGPVRVVRAHVPESYGRSYAGRMWAFAGFTTLATAAALRAGPIDVVIASSPPLTVAIPGLAAAKRHGAKFVFEVRDLWPESAVTTGVLRAGSPMTRALYALERQAYTRADRINVLTPAFRDDILRRGLAPADKICFVPNGADVGAFMPGPRDNAVRAERGWGERIVALYAGAHGRANALGQLLDAAERLRGRPDILVATVGDGPERAGLEADAKRRGLGNLMFCGAVPKDEMPGFVNAADIGLAVLQRNPTFRTVYPNKVFDYMACERPTVVGIDGVARALVCDDAQAGLFAEPEDGAALAAAITRLADDPDLRARLGRAGRTWVLVNATREGLAARYLSVLDELVHGKG